mmetsp:Transcript_14725/g.28203  ORF Transcript_14725/g.28203 Transcript_14725/m.28203 type:complete len:201 (+) Transcript_14725:712-1314(+)
MGTIRRIEIAILRDMEIVPLGVCNIVPAAFGIIIGTVVISIARTIHVGGVHSNRNKPQANIFAGVCIAEWDIRKVAGRERCRHECEPNQRKNACVYRKGSMRMRAASSAPNAAFGVDLRRAAASHNGNNKEGDLPQPVRTRSFRVLVHVSPESAKCSTNLLCVPHFWPSARGALDRSLAMGSTPPNNLLSASRLYVRLRD